MSWEAFKQGMAMGRQNRTRGVPFEKSVVSITEQVSGIAHLVEETQEMTDAVIASQPPGEAREWMRVYIADAKDACEIPVLNRMALLWLYACWTLILALPPGVVLMLVAPWWAAVLGGAYTFALAFGAHTAYGMYRNRMADIDRRWEAFEVRHDEYEGRYGEETPSDEESQEGVAEGPT